MEGELWGDISQFSILFSFQNLRIGDIVKHKNYRDYNLNFKMGIDM